MLHHELLLVLSLLFAIGVLHVLSGRLGISYPILLVLGGLALSLVPGAPQVSLGPDLVFLVFLPPLLYEAAWFTPWRELLVISTHSPFSDRLDRLSRPGLSAWTRLISTRGWWR